MIKFWSKSILLDQYPLVFQKNIIFSGWMYVYETDHERQISKKSYSSTNIY